MCLCLCVCEGSRDDDNVVVFSSANVRPCSAPPPFSLCSSFWPRSGEMIDNIMFSVERAHNYVETGAKNMRQAADYSRKSRKVSSTRANMHSLARAQTPPHFTDSLPPLHSTSLHFTHCLTVSLSLMRRFRKWCAASSSF